MTIKPNASPDEKDSPFYKKNEKFCSEFEHFIADKNGKVKGKYNAWSYLIYGKVSNPKNWTLKYEKSTLSSGNLLLSSKRQNLIVTAEWVTKRVGNHNSEFYIRKKTRFDFIKIMVNKSLSKFDQYDKYEIESKGNKSQLNSKLTKILKHLFNSGEVYIIDYRNDELKIKLKTDKHYFDIFNKLTEL